MKKKTLVGEEGGGADKVKLCGRRGVHSVLISGTNNWKVEINVCVLVNVWINTSGYYPLRSSSVLQDKVLVEPRIRESLKRIKL